MVIRNDPLNGDDRFARSRSNSSKVHVFGGISLKGKISLEIFEEVFMKEVSFELNFTNRGMDFNN